MDRNEAIDIVRKNWPDGRRQLSEALETLIPEFKGSDDERIRKAISQCVEDMRGQFEKLYSVHHKDAIAWLETQGEYHQNPYSGVSFAYNGHTWGMCARDNGVEILIDGQLKGRVFAEDANTKEMFIKALERVEEQNAKGYKLTDCDKNSWWEDFKTYCGYFEPKTTVCPKYKIGDVIRIKNSNHEFIISRITDEYYHSKGAFIQIRIADDVNGDWEYVRHIQSEPKFKVGDVIIGKPENCMERKPFHITSIEGGFYWDGDDSILVDNQDNFVQINESATKYKIGDWIVCCDYEPFQIIGIKNDMYKMSNGDNRPFYMIDNNHNIRLWTIQDAKDGDVLAEHETIVLFKKIEGLNIRCYCTYHYLGYNPTFYVDTLQNKTPYRPATKEQRDLLFQKMKEAGYELDTEKNELVKIEQKFKAEHGKYYYCIKDYFSGGKKQASKGDVVQALRGLPIMGLDDASEFFLPVNNMPLNNEIDHIVSPKFRVGDWVVLSSGFLSEILQIVRIDLMWKLYWFDDDSYLPIVDEDCLHLWRPQDAEDGDILVMTKDDAPFIFKGFLDKFHPDSPVAYGGILPEGIFDISIGDSWWDSGEMLPANKEQCDLLFKAIQEAGYQWDAEKKELKPLETTSRN